MNVQATYVIAMLAVLTMSMKVLLTANVMLGILETDLIVLVSKSFICVSKVDSSFFNHLLFVIPVYYVFRHH